MYSRPATYRVITKSFVKKEKKTSMCFSVMLWGDRFWFLPNTGALMVLKNLQSTLPKSNLHKSNNRLSQRSFQVLFSLYSIVFNPSSVEFSSRSYFFSPNRFDLGKVDCILNPKRAGLFCLSQVRGGADSAPPSDLGRGATKNSEIWHIRRVGQYERADKILILKIKAFFKYANLC